MPWKSNLAGLSGLACMLLLSAPRLVVKRPAEHLQHVHFMRSNRGCTNVLQENKHGVAVDRDELTGWVDSMDQYRKGKGADRQFWLSTWSGEPVSVHRKNQDAGPVRVAHPFLCVVGGLPPDLLTEMRGEGAVADGFMERILFAYPQEFLAAGETWASIPEECEEAWRDCLSRLWALEMVNDPTQGPRPYFVRLTESGCVAWKKFTDGLAAMRNDDSTPDCLKAALGKMNSYGARLALIIHLLRLVTGEVENEDVDGESMERVAKLVSYFVGHLRRVHAEMDADLRIAAARKLLKWIIAQNSRQFTRRDAYRGMRGTCKTVEDIDPLLSLLGKHGYIRPQLGTQHSGPGRKPSQVYEVNPDARRAETT